MHFRAAHSQSIILNHRNNGYQQSCHCHEVANSALSCHQQHPHRLRYLFYQTRPAVTAFLPTASRQPSAAAAAPEAAAPAAAAPAPAALCTSPTDSIALRPAPPPGPTPNKRPKVTASSNYFAAASIMPAWQSQPLAQLLTPSPATLSAAGAALKALVIVMAAHALLLTMQWGWSAQNATDITIITRGFRHLMSVDGVIQCGLMAAAAASVPGSWGMMAIVAMQVASIMANGEIYMMRIVGPGPRRGR